MNSHLSGRFITFEGIDGSGKTTACKQVTEWLEGNFKDDPVVQTREPGGTPTAEALRELLLSHKMDPHSELMLFITARIEHAREIIIPALVNNSWVLCDRYWDSTIAYQVCGRGLNRDFVDSIRQQLQLPEPAYTVLLDIDPQHPRLSQPDMLADNHLDNIGVQFQIQVRESFLQLAKECPERFIVVNSSQPLNQVQEEIREQLGRRLGVSG